MGGGDWFELKSTFLEDCFRRAPDPMRLCQSRGQWALAWSMIGLFPPSAATGCMPTVSLLLPKLRRTQCCSSPFFLFSFGEWCRRWHRAFVGAQKDCCTKNRRPTSPTKTKETPSSHKTEWCGSSHPVSGCDRSTPTTSMDRTPSCDWTAARVALTAWWT